MVELGVMAIMALLPFASTVLAAETNAELLDKIPPLKPPRTEIPPSFWEQHGIAITLSAIAAVLVVAAVVSFLARPKQTIVAPPAALAREALNFLHGQPEDGFVVSRVSQIVRRYIAAEFSLGSDELTTSEFERVVAGSEKVGDEVKTQVASFLRDCDQRKFSPSPPAPPLNAVSTASRLVDLAEARKKQLLATETAGTSAEPHG